MNNKLLECMRQNTCPCMNNVLQLVIINIEKIINICKSMNY